MGSLDGDRYYVTILSCCSTRANADSNWAENLWTTSQSWTSFHYSKK